MAKLLSKKANKDQDINEINDANRKIIYNVISAKQYVFLLRLIKKGFKKNEGIHRQN